MTVKDHYDKHLGNFYSWYAGDFEKNKNAFKKFCLENNIVPSKSNHAMDLGCGHGIQSIALAECGFNVLAIDFNDQLIAELGIRKKNLPVEIIKEDIRLMKKYGGYRPELIVCWGDTLTHLDSLTEVENLIKESYDVLVDGGKICLGIRDYSEELQDINRFIPVKSDAGRILTCFLEYTEDKVKVTDLLHEFEDGKWVQKVSSYFKVRIGKETLLGFLKQAGFKIQLDISEKGLISVIGLK